MKTKINYKKIIANTVLGVFTLTILFPIGLTNAGNSDKVVSPFKKVSKLECRFQDYDNLSSSCKQNLPELKTKDYSKYIKLNGGYNEYTRFYTELWASSYKYGWDVGYGGHMGTDIATSKGTPVHSIADGKVIVSKTDASRGKVITVEHNIRGKKVFSNYAHLSKLSVSVGNKVKAGVKIGEVGSTGNSTGNHLHFQIDLDTPFHPYYPSYKKCPYSYYKITEDGVCFDDLKASTIDPLLFLETKGAVLDNLNAKISKVVVSNNNTGSNKTVSTTKKTTSIKKISSNIDKTIFEKTVYLGYPKGDIREVQQLLRDIGRYDGNLTGNYRDILDEIIKYQLDKKLISNKNDNGAGRFGPMTRGTLKKDYDKFLAKGGKRNLVTITDKYSKNTNNVEIKNNVHVNNKVEVKNNTKHTINIKTQKISRVNILTRAQIEKKEIDNFLKYNNVKIDFSNIGGNIKLGQTETIKLNITKKSNDKPYRGNTPFNISIQTNESMLKIFPKKMFYFDKGQRDIKIKGLKEGNTTVRVKLGNETLKSFQIKVYNSNKTIYPKTGKIYASSKIALGQEKRAIVLFKDDKNKRLLNLKYGSTYTLKGEANVKICIKKGSLKDIKKIYYSKCNESNYKNEITFSYKDTVAGIVIFDYKATGKDAKIKIINNYDKKVLIQKKLVVGNPVDLKKNYVYHNDVIAMLKGEIANIETKGYFMQDKGLTEKDAKKWIEKSLEKIKVETKNSNIKKKINDKLNKLKKEKINDYKVITREKFLEKTYNYLTLTNVEVSVSKKYLDLDENLNKKANQIFGKNLTWKDKFGENYFRPNIELTRGEAAFFLNQIFIKNNKYFLTVK